MSIAHDLVPDWRMPLPLRLDIHHYETVVAIIECGTMTEAARMLAVTQSAMSRRLTEAERRLGVNLFARGADRRLTPTVHGITVHQAAERALGELSRLEEALIGARSQVQVTVRVGVDSYQCYHWYPPFLAALRADRPEIDCHLGAVDDAPATAIAARSVDLVLAPGEFSGSHGLITLFVDELVLVCAPSHPLAAKQWIEPSDLAGETFLTYNPRPAPGFEYERFTSSAGEMPRLVRAVPQTSAIIEMVAANAGVSILSRWATRPAVESGRLAAVRCGPDGLQINWHALFRKGDPVAEEVAGRLAVHFGEPD